MTHQHERSNANLLQLEYAAQKLGNINKEVVFLGGCITGLLISDSMIPDLRTTIDVDCIVDVMTWVDYHKIENKLEKQGFKRSMEDDVICRWHFDDLILDIMPINKDILGFGNTWYPEAICQFETHRLNTNIEIKTISAPYFIATKLEAFKTRGNNDFLASHDLEDIISVIDGRIELIDEIQQSGDNLKNYLQRNLYAILQNKMFRLALPGHLNYGASTDERVDIILKRIHQMTDTESVNHQ